MNWQNCIWLFMNRFELINSRCGILSVVFYNPMGIDILTISFQRLLIWSDPTAHEWRTNVLLLNSCFFYIKNPRLMPQNVIIWLRIIWQYISLKTTRNIPPRELINSNLFINSHMQFCNKRTFVRHSCAVGSDQISNLWKLIVKMSMPIGLFKCVYQ
jgi:hypothetical protein